MTPDRTIELTLSLDSEVGVWTDGIWDPFLYVACRNCSYEWRPNGDELVITIRDVIEHAAHVCKAKR